MSQVINKTLPLPPPDALVLPSQRVTERTPELRIEEEVIHIHGAEGVQAEDTSPETGVAVLAFVLISAFSGFGQCLLDSHTLCSLHLPLRAVHALIMIPTSER